MFLTVSPLKITFAYKATRVRMFIRVFVALLVLAIPLQVAAASAGDSVLPLNLLLAPPAPGFVLLGIEPAAVERPGSVADLTVSVGNATGNLTTLPSSYALQVAPFWISTAARNLTYDRYKGDHGIGDNFLQTLSISVATGSTAKTSGTALGVGVRFSPWQGAVDTVFTRRADSIKKLDYALAGDFLSLINDSVAKDTVMKGLKAVPESLHDTAWGRRYLATHSAIITAVESDTQRYSRVLASIKSIASSMSFERFGWKLDVAGGFVLNFPSSVFDSAMFGKSGVWLTGGYEARDWSLIGTTRLLAGPSPTDTTSLDFGARLTLPVSGKIAPSFEVVYRAHPATTPFIAQRLRYDLVFNVPVGSSKAISVTLGRDFGSSQNAKMILILNLLMGFGTNRPVQVSTA